MRIKNIISRKFAPPSSNFRESDEKVFEFKFKKPILALLFQFYAQISVQVRLFILFIKTEQASTMIEYDIKRKMHLVDCGHIHTLLK